MWKIAYFLAATTALDYRTDFLSKAELEIDVVLHNISHEWDVTRYPNFLKSLGMQASSWEMLTSRFTKKILNAFGMGTQNFTICFMGSSVTAGHDSYFSQSFPVVAQGLMMTSFTHSKINLVVHNLGIGNNPCMPYDLCSRTFCGADVDLIYWEQTYNCGFQDRELILEQFVRQAISIPSLPIIAFSDSSTPNWLGLFFSLIVHSPPSRREKECPFDLNETSLSTVDRDILRTAGQPDGIHHIATNQNIFPYSKVICSCVLLCSVLSYVYLIRGI
jgi:hypothetical protein